jgi:hypothetical protein
MLTLIDFFFLAFDIYLFIYFRSTWHILEISLISDMRLGWC